MIVLSSKKCVPCSLLKKELERNGINYIEIDVESPEGMEIAKKFGVKGVPVVIENDKIVMFGYNKEKVKELIYEIKKR